MATQRTRKRQNIEASQEIPPTKNRKTSRSSIKKLPATEIFRNSIAYSEAQADSVPTRPASSDPSHSWHHPPEFWDGRSKVPLCREALDQLDRRTPLRPACSSPAPLLPTLVAQDTKTRPGPAQTRPADLVRFARHGGPDLSDLRGYSSCATARSTPEESGPMRANHTGFEQHLADHGVRPIRDSQEPPTLEEDRAALANQRPSLTPSQFSEGTFRAFRERNVQAMDEADVFAHVIPMITGTWEANQPSAINMVFGNLAPLTDGTLAAPKPDLYYGTAPSQLDPTIRKELSRYIAPSTAANRPILPNFFLEVKGPDGSPGVMMQQICYDGAIGTRAMHSLQNCRESEPTYDGQVYTYSSTYQNDQLQLYEHHATAAPGGQPEYHTTRLGGYSMTHSRETFLEGATAFRNARDLAKQHRDNFIRDANWKLQVGIEATQKSIHKEQDMQRRLHEFEHGGGD